MNTPPQTAPAGPAPGSLFGALAPPMIPRVAGILRQQIKEQVKSPTMQRQLLGLTDSQLVAAVRDSQPDNYAQVISQLAGSMVQASAPPTGRETESAALNLLPAAGSTAGSLIGGTGGTVFGLGVGAVPGALVGATLGGAGGEALEQLLRRALGFSAPATSADAAKKIGIQGLVGGASEGAAQLVPVAAPALRRAAEAQYERALAPTKAVTKNLARRITPELLRRRTVITTLARSQQGAEQRLESIGAKITDAAIRHPATVMPSLRRVITSIGDWKKQFITNGVPINDLAVAAADKLAGTIKQLGPRISYRSLNEVRQILDEEVAKAGGYAGNDLVGRATLDANRAAANAIRDELAKKNPQVAALKAEYTLWARLRDVLAETTQRRAGQSGGLARVIGPSLGGGLGAYEFVTHGAARGAEVLAVYAALHAAVEAARSPLWRSASAITKYAVADAIASGNGRLAMRMISHILAGAGNLESQKKGGQ